MSGAFLVMMAIVGMLFVGEMDGQATTKMSYQNACIAKYADMPHNKVEDFCTTLLKFEKEPK